MSEPRKHSKFQTCERHRPWFSGQGRRRILECFVEGGPGGWSPGCEGGRCRLWPGTDVFEPSVCSSEMELEWTIQPREVSPLLEDLRAAFAKPVERSNEPSPRIPAPAPPVCATCGNTRGVPDPSRFACPDCWEEVAPV